MDNFIGKYRFNILQNRLVNRTSPNTFGVKLNYNIQDTATFTSKLEKKEEIARLRSEAVKALQDSGLNLTEAKKTADSLSDKQLEAAKGLIISGVPPFFAYSDIKKFSEENVENCMRLMKNGFDYPNAFIAMKGNFDFDSIFADTKDGYKYTAQELDGKGIKISASKSFYNRETGVITVVEKTFNENGKNTVSRTEYDEPNWSVNEKGEYLINGKQTNCSVPESGNPPEFGIKERAYWEINGEYTPCEVTTPVRSHYIGSDKSIEMSYQNDKNNIQTQLELICDETGQPSEILFTKQSDKLKGAFETVKYTLADYDEDRDVISEIKNGTIEGGEVLSKVTETDDGGKLLTENFTRNGCEITREFYENDGFYSYSYVINDENGNNLMNLSRSLACNPDGTTTTVINDKQYDAVFDDENKISTITDSDGNETVINFGEKIINDESGEFWDFIKTLPADNLISFGKYTSMIIPSDKNDSQIMQGILQSGTDSFIIKHETGHAEDFKDDWNRRSGDISGNEELIKIYEEEAEAFNKEYTEVSQDVIRYFMPGGGSSVTGLAELTAETGALFGTYGSDTEAITTRGQYLVRYFPKTTAKIAELTGYNK